MAQQTATAATDLVSYVNKLLNLKEEKLDFAAEISKGEFQPVITAFSAKVEELLALEAETDIEGTFNLLFLTLKSLPKEKFVTEAKKITTSVVAKHDTNSLLRLRIVTNLFNLSAEYPELRFETLIKLIEFASKSKQLDLISNYFDDIDELIDAKSFNAEKKRKLYVVVADVLEKADSKSIKILLFLEKYLSTFINSDKDVASAKDVAIRAVKLVLKSPVVSFVSRVDIVGNPAVVALKSDAKHAKLVQLLEIYSTQTLTEYLAFQKSAGSFFKDNGLKEEDCAAFMRLFTLCSFPTGFDEIPYATVAKKLSIKEDEVEPWVVKAVTQNVIQAKIDQLKKSVVISRTLQRGFGLEQWKEVQVKLNLYTKNVGAMLEAVRNARNL